MKLAPPTAHRRPSRPGLRVIALVVALSTSFSSQAQGLGGFLGGLKNVLDALPAGAASAPAGAALPLPLPANQLLGGNTGNAALNQALGPAQGAPMTGTLAALFAKGTVNGADLFDTLKSIKLEAQAKRSAASWAAANAAFEQGAAQAAAGGMPNLNSIAGDLAFKLVEEQMKTMVATVSMQALDGFLQVLLDDSAGLATESITLPSGAGMTEVQGKRIINMAAMIVAARLTEKMLDKANKDLSTLQTDYKGLIEQREKASNVLFALIDQRRNAQRSRDDAALATAEGTLKSALSPTEISFIDNQLLNMKAADFAKDMAAQNFALKVLQRTQPDAFAQYRVKADEVVVRTNSYVKTVTGVAAFGGLLLNFSKQMVELGREKNMPNLLQAMPLGIDFVRAAVPAAKLSVETALNGFVLQPASGFGGFFSSKPKAFVMISGDKREEFSNASEVFAALDKQGAKDLFAGALFRNDTPGWLSGVYECDAAETGRMIDAAVPGDQRDAFAKAYLNQADASGFSFMNTLTLPAANPRERRLAQELLQRDHRRSTNDATNALAAVQGTVAEKYTSWGNPQLLRLVFANRDGARAAEATVEVGQIAIRPIPSADSVYAYESHTDACKVEEKARIARERASAPVAVAAPARPAPPPEAAAAPAQAADKKATDKKSGSKTSTTTKKATK